MLKLASDGLPEGYFYSEDIRFYRWLAGGIRLSGVLVEVGCFLGRSTCVAGPVIRANQVRMICIDNWEGSVGDDTHAIAQSIPMRDVFQQHLLHFGLSESIDVRTGDSTLSAESFADESVDAVFIDANHAYACVSADIRAWWPKIRREGILSGHDYYHSPQSAPHCAGVKEAVDETFGAPDCVTGSCWHVQKPLAAERLKSPGADDV
jgi:predicted O-methyltransferase YrrM